MAHPTLGFCILAFVVAGLFLFDGFLGLTYLASFVVPDLMPSRLYKEAFYSLHSNKGLPLPAGLSDSPPLREGVSIKSKDSDVVDGSSRMLDDEELELFLAQGAQDDDDSKVQVV